MGRYIGPACKRCRRQGMKLFLKGDRCYMAKCPIEQGASVPGPHGGRRPRLKDYGIQLQEKQRLRNMYGMQEGQFRLFFQRALRARGVTGELLLQALEMRLDNIVYRIGLAPSRRAARQFVRHGHIRVNGIKVNIPSYKVKPGEVVQARDVKHSREYSKAHLDAAESRGWPVWMNVDKAEYKAVIDHVPTREEIAPVVNEQLIVELYSK
ncbi:MAG TPA: 30S ribosomal protein S4 [Verrucomicrobia bacterium]|nr:30S ribosomal protein S4 [Verrucomicrobiota bacterium]